MHQTRHLRLVPPPPADALSPSDLPSYDEIDAALDDVVEALVAVRTADAARRTAIRALLDRTVPEPLRRPGG